jgi:site-specific DNA recombinase
LWCQKKPYGYIIGENRKLAPGDAHEVATVRRIFAEYIAGKSVRETCFALNANGERNGNAGQWSSSTVRGMLVNKAYVGTFDRCGVTIQNNHPAIIDAATFATVQRLLVERKPLTTPVFGGGDYLFTGLIRCGKCGSAMHGRRDGGKAKYYCVSWTHNKSCDANAVHQGELAEHVIDAVCDRFMNPAVVKRLRDELHRQVKTTTRQVNVEKLRQQVTAIEGKLAKAKRRLVEVDHDMLAVVQENIRDLIRQRGDIDAALDAAKTPQNALMAAADAKVDMAMERFARLRETLQQADTIALRELLRETVTKVDVWAERRQRGRQAVFMLDHGTIYARPVDLCGLPR